ncbi:MAG: RidA family protein, partial [Chitinophagaceae bacterium]
MEQTAEQRFAQSGLTLPPAPAPLGVYKPCLVVGNFLYVSGHGTVKEDGTLIMGRIGKDMSQEEGK